MAAETAATASSISRVELNIVQDYSAQPVFENASENTAMLNGLEGASNSGEDLTGADLNLCNHEMTESALQDAGLSIETGEAHEMAGLINGVSPYSLYAPEVIQNYPDVFNQNWFDYWDLPY